MSQKNFVRKIIFSSGFLLANSHILCILTGCNRQSLLIKIYAGASNILKIKHHLLKLRASKKWLKQMLFLLFSNFLVSIIIWTRLKELHYVPWFVIRWMIWTTWNDLYSVQFLCSVELFVHCSMICITLNNFEKSVRRWMIRAAFKDLYYVEWFGVWWMICIKLNHLD